MRTKKNYLCVYTLFFMCLFSCGGSKNTLLELPKDIQRKYEYFIREGETISFKYPSYFDLDPSFDLAGFFKNDLHEYDSYILEGKNLDCLSYKDCNGYGQLTCVKKFKEDVIITGILKGTNEENTYIKFPCDMVVHYSSLALSDECIFPISYSPQTQNGNGPADMRQVNEGWNPSNEDNEIYYYINPTQLGIKKSQITIDSCEALYSHFKIENVSYYLYRGDNEHCKLNDFSYSPLPGTINGYNEPSYSSLILKFTFSDSLNNTSSFTGGTIKFNVTLDGDSYEVYRDVHYRRHCE